MSNTESDRLANANTNANGDSHIRADCFSTNRGLNQHLRLCYLKKKTANAPPPYKRNKSDVNDQTPEDSNTGISDISTPSRLFV